MTRHATTPLFALTLSVAAAQQVAAQPDKTAPPAAAPAPAKEDPSAARAGRNFIATPVFSEQEDQRLLTLFRGLRVADVQDGMDAVGLHNGGLMDSSIRPLWTDPRRFTHRMIGIAVTARYVPTNRPMIGRVTTEAYDKWADDWYGKLSNEPFGKLIRKGTVVVIEDAAGRDVGSIGSMNIMVWKTAGMLGVVTSTTARDTDEITLQKVPLYFQKPGRGIRPGRNEIESINRPIVCGGVLVVPGDVVVADGDGVVVVPRAHAEDVARYAQSVIEKDKKSRRGLYKKLGMPADETIR